MRTIVLPLALVGALAASAVLAQAPPPPAPGQTAGAPAAPPVPGPTAAGDPALPPPPPPRGGPLADRPPPPPPGAHVVLDRGANGFVHVDVHCAEQETTKDCADIAGRLLAETGGK